jgi:antibiotic biosynthesis monooxygenase (ABM) superfamily enzyme
MNASTPDEPVHVAITRRVKPGCELAFQEALRDFLKISFGQSGVRGATMLVPPPGSGSSEFGILRTFASRRERDAFYESPLFKEWNKRISPLTEGSPERRELIGLEAWFRSSDGPPPRWKMAIATYLGVVPTIMTLALTVGALIHSWNFVFYNLLFNACVVVLLTWVVMPLITRALHGWLNAKPAQNSHREQMPIFPSPKSNDQ